MVSNIHELLQFLPPQLLLQKNCICDDCHDDGDQVAIDFTSDEPLLETDNLSHNASMTVCELNDICCTVDIRKAVGQWTEKMSLLQQKRLQWAAEKEQISEWNPWGRPGCGAPVVSYTATTVSQSTQQHQMAMWSRDAPKHENYSTDVSTPLHISCTPNDLAGRADRNRLPPLPASLVSPGGQRSLPSTLVSSLGFNNNPFIYTYAYDLWKEEAKKQWLQDLDKQREEQRLRKLNNGGIVHSNSDVLSFNSSSKIGLDHLNSASIITPLVHQNSFSALPSVLNNYSESAPMSNIDASSSIASWPNKTFLRGANVPIDPATQTELAIRRAKALEQQEAIQMQIEERRRVKEKERADEKQRELEEELRIAKDRNPTQSNINQDQMQIKSKESPEKVATVKVNSPGQTSRLPDVVDGTFKDPSRVDSKPVEEPSAIVNKNHLTIPSLGPTVEIVKNEKNVSFEEQAPYVVNRVLTPTKYRGNIITSRDCATQTDFANNDSFPSKKSVGTSTKINNEKRTTRSQSEVRAKHSQRNNSKGRGKESRDSASNKVVEKQNNDQRRTSTKSSKRSESRLDSDDQGSRTSVSRRSDHQSKSNGSRRSNAVGSSGVHSHTSASRRSRSSAEYQRKVINDEDLVQNYAQRRSLSPMVSYSRLTATGSSSTCDEGDLSGHPRPTRRKRRQWESPGRDEIPHFYTDSPQLPDSRHIRRNRNAAEGNKFPNSLNEYPAVIGVDKCHSNRETFDECPRLNNACATPISEGESTLNPVPLRSDSPPVPALRRLQLQQNMRADGTDNCTWDGATDAGRMDAIGELQKQNSRLEELSSSWPIDWKQSFHSTGAHLSSLKNEMSSNQKCIQTPDVDRDDILRKLSIIRHNLSLKQQEVNQMSSDRTNFELNTNR